MFRLCLSSWPELQCSVNSWLAKTILQSLRDHRMNSLKHTTNSAMSAIAANTPYF